MFAFKPDRFSPSVASSHEFYFTFSTSEKGIFNVLFEVFGKIVIVDLLSIRFLVLFFGLLYFHFLWFFVNELLALSNELVPIPRPFFSGSFSVSISFFLFGFADARIMALVSSVFVEYFFTEPND